MDNKTDTNPPILCVRCGGAGANVYDGGVWSHHFWRDCIEHLTARVEAAKVERNIAARRAFNAEAENQRLAADNRRLSAELAAPRLRAGERDERGETMKPDDAAIMHTAPLVDFDLEWITGPARALLARVEAAEALAYERLEAMLFAEQRATDAELECDDLRDANTVQAEALETTRQTLVALTARVAELEAEQEWGPGSVTPPKHDWYWVLDFSEDDRPLYCFYGAAGWMLPTGRATPDWYIAIPPLPPAPNVQETTP